MTRAGPSTAVYGTMPYPSSVASLTPPDPIEAAMVAGACLALAKRAAALRKRAANYTTEIVHHGRVVMCAQPEASIALGTAQLLEACADDLRERSL